MTQNELVTDEKPHQHQPTNPNSSDEAKPVLRTATVQVAPPERLNSLGRKNSIDQQKSMNTASMDPSNSALHASSNFSNNFSNDMSADSAMSSEQPKSLGVKSMMSRFNNLSSQPLPQPGANFSKHVDHHSNFSSNNNNNTTTQFTHPETASTFSHQPAASLFSQQPQFKPASYLQQSLPNYANDTNNAHKTTLLQTQTLIGDTSSSISISSSNHVEAASSSENTASVPHASAYLESTASQPLVADDEPAVSLIRQENQQASEAAAAAVTNEEVVVAAANVEIAETNNADLVETVVPNDSNTLSLTPADTSISNNEIINTNITLNNQKNEQEQEQQQQSQQQQDQQNHDDVTPAVQEEVKQEAAPPTTQNESAGNDAQEVIETSEF